MSDLVTVANQVIALKQQAEAYSQTYKSPPPASFSQAAEQLRSELSAMGAGDLASALGSGRTASEAQNSLNSYLRSGSGSKTTTTTAAPTKTSASRQVDANGVYIEDRGIATWWEGVKNWWSNLTNGSGGAAAPATTGGSAVTNTQTPSLAGVWSMLSQAFQAIVQYLPLLIIGWLLLAFSRVFQVRAKWGGAR